MKPHGPQRYTAVGTPYSLLVMANERASSGRERFDALASANCSPLHTQQRNAFTVGRSGSASFVAQHDEDLGAEPPENRSDAVAGQEVSHSQEGGRIGSDQQAVVLHRFDAKAVLEELRVSRLATEPERAPFVAVEDAHEQQRG